MTRLCQPAGGSHGKGKADRLAVVGNTRTVETVTIAEVAFCDRCGVLHLACLIPFRYSQGKAASWERVLRTYGRTSAERKVTGSPVLE